VNGRRMLVLGLVAVSLLAGCKDEEAQRAEQQKAANDSLAAARARGETDLSNPEMGAKVSVIITDSALQQSHTEVPKGQLTMVVENKSTGTHVFEMKSDSVSFKTVALVPASSVLLTVIVDKPGLYSLACPDTGATAKGCGNGKLSVR
jgi:glucose/arabinose dehydrogenase